MRTARALAIAALLLGGCANPYDRVVLLPDPAGDVGRVIVTRSGTTTELADAYASARAYERGAVEQVAADPAEVQRPFAPVLEALPPRPVTHTVYFMLDSDELTPESREQALAILAEVAQRPVADIVVIGHTDRVGGLSTAIVCCNARRRCAPACGAGRRPRTDYHCRTRRADAVVTADEVPEPRNRRAQIDVR